MVTSAHLTFQQFKLFTLAALWQLNLRELGWRPGHWWWWVEEEEFVAVQQRDNQGLM